MATTGRLRQSILKDAIRENVDVIEGRLPRGLRRSDRIRRTIFRASVFVIVPLALFLSINALTTGKGERTDVLVVSTPAAAPAPAPRRPARPDGAWSRRSSGSPCGPSSSTRATADPTRARSATGGVREKDVTLDVATRLKALLEAGRTLAVSLTRDGDATLSLKDRVVLANARRRTSSCPST